ncbi:MAG TPA: hypothetical protein VF920_00045 [Dongiaceae bacterium]
MEQKTEPLSPEDLDHLERQRNWVRDHYAPLIMISMRRWMESWG